MHYKFTGENPELFPTVQMLTVDGEPHGAVIEPGETVDVVAVDDVPGAPVIHARLLPVKAHPAKKTAKAAADTEESK